MSDLLTSEYLKTERATEPPKRWRNWWWADGVVPIEGGIVRGPGEYEGLLTFPSQEIARQKAYDWLKRTEFLRSLHELSIEYLGAFPDGEAP